jgi:hypothetical protein
LFVGARLFGRWGACLFVGARLFGRFCLICLGTILDSNMVQTSLHIFNIYQIYL